MVRFPITFRFSHLSLPALGTHRNDEDFFSVLFVDVMGIFLRAILHFDLLLSFVEAQFFLSLSHGCGSAACRCSR
jgi:hypothetical protein